MGSRDEACAGGSGKNRTGSCGWLGNSDSCFRSGIVVGDETNQGRAKIESS